MDKKILFVIPFYGNINNAIARRFVPIIELFISRGYEVFVITSHNGVSLFGEVVVKTYIDISSNRSHIFFRLLKEFIWGLEVGLRISLSSFRKLNTIVTSPSYIGFLVYSGFIKKSKKMIFDMRDIYPHVLWHTNVISKDGLFKYVLMKLTRLKILKFRKVVTVSDGLLQEINKWLGIKASLIYNGYPDELLRISVKKNKIFTVVMHGTLGAAQNIELLVEVARSYEHDKEIEFVVIGKGSEDYRVKNLNFLEYVEDLPQEELFRKIAACHLGCSLRIDGWLSQTALPVKVFEYLGLGLPVVATPPGELSNILIGDNMGRTVSNNLEILIETIEYFRGLPQQSEIINNQFSRKKQSELFYKEYEELFFN